MPSLRTLTNEQLGIDDAISARCDFGEFDTGGESASVGSSVMASYSAILPSVVGRGRVSADSATDDVSLRPPGGLRPGRDVPLTALDAGGRFRLACDSLQWITQRRRGKTWRGDSFVTTRKVLLRDLRELGCELTPEARAAIEALPETFQEWLEQRTAQGGSLRGVRAPSRTIRRDKVA